ncbi:MAG: heavy-metal-associated domain-containing protein [Pseudonocardia sp.]|uniref:heavy-metal-associated domain-containing protein n=1 Tax=unclassified Pseudonocardia TaxID=2619320 RepID=UPI00086B2016|nr:MULTISPECIES: heavy metal-associated domain-containing protein [unclassified Pseudonocardia]MBN9112695.1 heavy-metal-associated domain-containing protein [Pseudonocardia sp.]ODU09117.1 MAG: cation-transporting ATPase [Pseudonocardia sp. SCN 72-51]ODV00116.1 MAG: cation-transporting ATPase [Pseudonocardia sp. SCN 73-27]
MSIEAPYRTDVVVSGMTCGHCTASVKEEVGEVDGVRDVEVDLSTGLVTITSVRELPLAEIRDAVTEAGYTLAD